MTDIAPSAPVGTPPNGRGRPGYTRDEVIARAVEAFNMHGYEATSMGALAKKLGVSKSALYHHVTSKEEILVEATDSALRGLTEVIDAVAREPGTATAKLEKLLAGSVRVLCSNPENVTLLLRLRGNTEVELEIMERRREVTRRGVAFVRAAQAEGGIRKDLDPGAVTRLMFGMVNSIVEWYHPDGEVTPDELAGLVPRIVFEGVRSEA